MLFSNIYQFHNTDSVQIPLYLSLNSQYKDNNKFNYCNEREIIPIRSLDIIKHMTLLGPLSQKTCCSLPQGKKTIHCLLSKHPKCIPAEGTLTSHTTRTRFLRREKGVLYCLRACVWEKLRGKWWEETDTSTVCHTSSHTPLFSLFLFTGSVFLSVRLLSSGKDGTSHCCSCYGG